MPDPNSHPGAITTLRRLTAGRTEALGEELQRFSRDRPVTLLLPCHVDDTGADALDVIIRELAAAPWISRIIVGLDGAKEDDTAAARVRFCPLGDRLQMIWTNAPEILQLERSLDRAGFTSADSGKGRNVWLALGAALAGDPKNKGIIAMHDCDIRNYSREIPARLCWPLLAPGSGFRFVKGCYARHADRLHGRVMRFLVTPLLRALETVAGPLAALRFLSAFQYPLAGETAMDAALARGLAVPAAWGLEIGLLEEVRRQTPVSAVCQSELCAAYDHKHQDLSPDDPEAGLHRMAREVASAVLSTVSGGAFPWQELVLPEWRSAVENALRCAAVESALNGLEHSVDDDRLAVRTFGLALDAALDYPDRPALLPSWEEIEAHRPGSSAALAMACR